MEYLLVVRRPFGAFRRGDVIEDMAMITNILAGDLAAFVIRVAATVNTGA